MRCKQEPVKSFDTLDDALRPDYAAHFFLQQINNQTFDEKQFFANKQSVTDLNLIIKLANENRGFANMCQKNTYKALWEKLYSQLGLIISPSTTKEAFYTHSDSNTFDLLRGAYFFFASQRVKTALSYDFSNSEIRFLKKAIEYKSVHAVQRYNAFIYQKIANQQLEADENANDLLKMAINNAKSLLELYGSYAYMLLADAYYHYALWKKNNGETAPIRRALQSAIDACSHASKHLDKSQFSIRNASFGNGLGFSNSLGISSPEEAKRKLELCLEDNSYMNGETGIDNNRITGSQP